MSELSEFAALMNRLEKVYSQMPNKAATMAVNFSKERFREQAWLDKTKNAWAKRKRNRRGGKKRQGGAVLVDTARLKRSIRKVHVGADYAIIGTDVPYAKAHNEGFKGTVTVREHKRKKITEKYKTRKGNERTRKVRVVDTSAKASVVKKHTRKMNLPQRQFMGNSATLEKRIQLMISADLLKAMK